MRTPERSNSDRARAWRNMMVAAINAGLEQKLFGLQPGQNYWISVKGGDIYLGKWRCEFVPVCSVPDERRC